MGDIAERKAARTKLTGHPALALDPLLRRREGPPSQPARPPLHHRLTQSQCNAPERPCSSDGFNWRALWQWLASPCSRSSHNLSRCQSLWQVQMGCTAVACPPPPPPPLPSPPQHQRQQRWHVEQGSTPAAALFVFAVKACMQVSRLSKLKQCQTSHRQWQRKHSWPHAPCK